VSLLRIPLLMLALLLAGGCWFYPPEGNRIPDGPPPSGPSCYDRLVWYDSDTTANGCGADATSQLASLPAGLRRLVLCDSKLGSTAGLARLSKLEELVLYHMKELSSLEPLSACVSLRKLDLTGSSVASFDFLRALGGLDALELRATALADASPLSGLHRLVELDLSETKVNDLRPLGRLTALRVLRLSGTAVHELGPLAGLVSLEELYVDGTSVEISRPSRGCISCVFSPSRTRASGTYGRSTRSRACARLAHAARQSTASSASGSRTPSTSARATTSGSSCIPLARRMTILTAPSTAGGVRSEPWLGG